jgi:hypothetical protein
MKIIAPSYESVCDTQNWEVGRVAGKDYDKACEMGFDFDYVFEQNESGEYEYDPQELTEEVVAWANAHLMPQE